MKVCQEYIILIILIKDVRLEMEMTILQLIQSWHNPFLDKNRNLQTGGEIRDIYSILIGCYILVENSMRN